MDIFIARQPVFTPQRRVFGYELLYRGTVDSSLKNTSGNKATTSVLTSAFLTEGVDKITGGKPCFVNFTRDLLLQNVPASFPQSLVIVEILEDVPPTAEIVDIVKELRNSGYSIALDDFVYSPSLEPLLQLANIIKFDFRISSVDTIQKTIHRLARYQLKYLAEKIETYSEFHTASKMGFSYFQGYFFCKPERIRIKEIDSSKIHLIALLAEVNKKSTTVRKIEQLIKNDVGMTYKLLRYINSAYFYRINRIESVSHAITYLGEREMKRFIVLMLISQLATDKPDELINLALTRAKMCELLAKESSFKEHEEEIFLLGLFSLLDAMLDTPMAEICEHLSLSQDLTEALSLQRGPLYPFLFATIAYEQRKKTECLQALAILDIPSSKLYPIYLEAVSFSQSFSD